MASLARGRDCLDDDALHAYVEGALPADRALRAKGHLADCTVCRELVAAAVPSLRAPPGASKWTASQTVGEATLVEERLAPDDPLAKAGLLAGKYRIEAELGSGGMGRVLRAYHAELDRQVAIKVMHTQMLTDLGAIRRFAREAKAAAALTSPNLVRIYDVGQMPDGAPYLVMELLDGVDLDRHLTMGHPLPVGEVVKYAIEACEGLAEAHGRGLVHRDIKPANLFLAKAADGRFVTKLLDFGLAKTQLDSQSAPESSVTLPRAIVGSPYFMSPEQVRSPRDVDARTDIWSLGATLYQLLVGVPPFTGEGLSVIWRAILSAAPAAPSTLRRDVPTQLDAVVLRCLEKDPAARFPTAQALADALRPFATPSASRPSFADSAIVVAMSNAPTVAAPMVVPPPAAPLAPLPLAPPPVHRAAPAVAPPPSRVPYAVLALGIAIAALGTTLLLRSRSYAAPENPPPPATTTEAKPSATTTDPPPPPAVDPAPTTIPTASVTSASPSASASPRPSATTRRPPPPKAPGPTAPPSPPKNDPYATP